MVRRIGLLNHIGLGNLGDDATEVAVMQNIRNRWPDAEISLFSMNPTDTRSRHGVPAYAIRWEFWNRWEGNDAQNLNLAWTIKKALRQDSTLYRTLRVPARLLNELRFLARSYRVVRQLDLLIVSGGGQLLDSWGGPWKFPYTVFMWTLLAKVSRIKCYFLNVGAGPIDHPLAKWFVRNALRLAEYVSFRDGGSRNLVQAIGFKGKSQVFADCVCALQIPRSSKLTAPLEGRVVGMSPMAYGDPRVYWQKDAVAYERLVHNVASFGRWLCDNRYELALFSTDIWFDLQTIGEVKRRVEDSGGNPRRPIVRQQRIAGIDDLISQMQSMDYIVTCRFHGVVFAHLLNKPVLALSHHSKVLTLMNDLGLAKYCLDIKKCEGKALQDTFLSLLADQDEIKSRMAEKLASYRRSLSLQFDSLFPSVTPTVMRSCTNECP